MNEKHDNVPEHDYVHAHVHDHHVLTAEEILPDDLPAITPVVSDHDRQSWPRALVGLVAVCVTLLLALVAIQPFFYAWQLRSYDHLAKVNNKVLTAQIPGLQGQIARDKQTISDQQNVIQQAVDAITTLAKKCEAAPPCNPGEIELKPPKH